MGWPIVNTAVDVQLKGICQGQFCYVNLAYYQVNTNDNINNFAPIADAFDSIVLASLIQVQTDSFQWLSIKIQGRGTGQTGKVYQRNVNRVGVIDAQALPVYNTWSFVKVPDNTQILPGDRDPFRMGRFNLSGVPETWVADGEVDPTRQSTLDSYAESVLLVPEGVTRVWGLFMRRDPDGLGGIATDAVAPVSAVYFNRLGTQLTRKY